MRHTSSLEHPLLEPNKRAGVRYALNNDGVELAIVDTTNPAFAMAWDETTQRVAEENFARQQAALGKVPPWLRKLMLAIHLRGSLLARGLRRARGGYLTGMETYLLKLGPDNLPTRLAKPVDREIAASLPVAAVRLRLQDVARLTAEVIAAELAAAEPGRPLVLLNIAAGPAIDSLNALLVLRRERQDLVRNRRILIRALDVEASPIVFGQRALGALQDEGGPLHELDIELRYSHYDWKHPSGLLGVLEAARAESAVVVAASEGGLFDYGSDDEIIDNLRALCAGTISPAKVIGSTTRDDAVTRRMHEATGALVRCRAFDDFSRVIARAGYRVTRRIERPFSNQVTLCPIDQPRR